MLFSHPCAGGIHTNQIGEEKAEEGASKSDGKEGEGEEGGSEAVQEGWVEPMMQRIHSFHLFQRFAVRLISITGFTHHIG